MPMSSVYSGPLFKILPASRWQARTSHVPRMPIDEADGFVHLSSREQVKSTAQKHFATATQLVLLRLESTLQGLRWEPSRGGALFPHVYGDIPLSAVQELTELVGDEAGRFSWPEDLG